MDRLTELEAFLAVVETGGFTAAGRRTGASQSAVSKAIGTLENRLGVALFNRSTRNVTLTDQGQNYFDRMKPLIEEIDDANREVMGSAVDMSGSIRIAVPTTFGRLHILPIVPDLLSEYPNLQLDLVLSDLTRDMVEDRVDLAIRVGAVEEPDAVVRRLTRTPLVCVGSRQYFEKHGIPKQPAELAHHNCLVYAGFKETANWPFVGPQGRFSISVRGNLSSNSIETIRAGVLAGVGIGMFTRASLVEELSHSDVVTILDDYVRDTRDISFVWPKRRLVSARVRRVTDFLAASLEGRV
ncbi:LysR family transcriptional regulator [Rhizobium sp. VS19-DR104.2]|uniref:LysR family transcriptional regulator n=1 Tax=unclassified Rhizobium TaxID=2613769 RepID=UPI001C5AFEE0|nr:MULTISPECIES: LysR family transcriptional regulator [unclassified Rhizobium]MBZ5762109.1 LysR family transcriptional regulator [Rhizobium sp. VS19-DR96]MBZ5768222.1 LysR family transcriptional regulator [Rhizobium sp. VS19-DR129.2]MBZ5775713.1 LysR family transcriptional regulator [Rhizobium sp. VS19-DRK62.2]MBZ5786986.1 LysR family transcriptional regulator [Rhizobium sp. VS19-DR121]MBZ5804147.1 LysR family transcriptional regulator [Rhizobium sp. VS19-DR181]